MKHIVLIVGSYYPNYSAVGKCMGNIANELTKDNRVTVICEKTSLDQSDSDMVGLQKIIRVTTKRKERYLRYNDSKQLGGKIFNTIKGNYYTAERFIYRLISKTSIDKEMVSAYEKTLTLIKDKIDVIIPTCSPFESVIAACNYKKYNKSVNIIPYLFDLFSDNNNLNYFKIIKTLKWKENIKLEEEAFKCSKRILHIENWSPHILNNLSEHLDKCILVEHPLLMINKEIESNSASGYLPDLKKKNSDQKEGNKHNLIFAGALRKGYVDASDVIKLFSNDLLNGSDVFFFSSGNGIVDVINCKQDNIHLCEWVPREELEKIYEKADAFISIAEKNGRQISSKIFDYMSHRKPIIHFYFNDNDVNIKYLKSYKHSLLIKIDGSIGNKPNLINEFLSKEETISVNYLDLNESLLKCTPEYISTIIRKWII